MISIDLKVNHGKLEANLHKLILLRTRHSPPAYTRSHLGLWMVFLVQCSHTERMNSTVQSNPRELDQTSVWFQSEHLAFSPVQFRHKPSNCTANQSNHSQLQSKSPVFPLASLPPLSSYNPLLSCLFPAFDKWSISFKVCKLIKFIIRSKSDKWVPTFTSKVQ